MNLFSDKIQIKALREVAIKMHQGINTVTEKIQYQEDGFPIIQSKHITQGILDLSDARFIGALDFQKYKDKYNPQINDILICNIGTIGKSILISEKVDFLIAWNLFLISLDDSQVFSAYLKQYLDHLGNKNYFNQFLTGGTVKFVNKSNMGGIKIPLPPIAEQKRIAEILDRTQSLISKRKEAIAKLDTLTKSIFLEMFGDPVKNPKRWDSQTLEEIAIKITDGEHLNPDFSLDGMPIVMAGNVLEGFVDIQNAKKVDVTLGEKFRRKCSPERGDILLVSRGATIGRLCTVDFSEDFCLMGSVILIKLNHFSVESRYLKSLLKQPSMYAKLFNTSGSSAQQAIYLKDLKRLICLVPSLPLQKEFAQRVEAV